MREVQAILGEDIHLGRRGENLATCVTFDVSEWQMASEGTVHLLHQRNGDEYPYPCAITVENGMASWVITAADVEFAGRGKAELQYLDGDVCIKSAVFATKTLRALGKAGEAPPEPEETWVQKVLEAGGSAMESSEYAQQSAKEAEESAAAAKVSEEAARVAHEAAEEAIEALGDIEENKLAAEAARKAIEDMTVTSEVLEGGSEASVEKSLQNEVVNLHFGIPKGLSGVYVGSGPMPEGYNVQIDPDGDVEDIVAEVVAAGDEQVRRIEEAAEEIIAGGGGTSTGGVWAPPIVSEVSGTIVEINSPVDAPIQGVTVPSGSAANSIYVWGKNHLRNDKGATVTNIGVTVTWDAENQEFVFNGTTTAAGDLKLITPMVLDWVAGEKYTLTATRVSGTATLAPGSGAITYAWGIFQDNAAKFVRGATILTSFVDAYIFTGTAFEPQTGHSLIFYFQCWRPGTVFEDYRVKIQIEKGENSTEWEEYRYESVPVAEATSLLLRKGYNYIKAVPMEEISVSYVADTKTYVDAKVGSGGGTAAKVEGNTLIL